MFEDEPALFTIKISRYVFWSSNSKKKYLEIKLIHFSSALFYVLYLEILSDFHILYRNNYVENVKNYLQFILKLFLTRKAVEKLNICWSNNGDYSLGQ